MDVLPPVVTPHRPDTIISGIVLRTLPVLQPTTAVIPPVTYRGSAMVRVTSHPSPIIRAPKLPPDQHVPHPITTPIPQGIGQFRGQALTNHPLRLFLWITSLLTTHSLGMFKMNKFFEFLCPDWNDRRFRMMLMETSNIALASSFSCREGPNALHPFAIPSSLSTKFSLIYQADLLHFPSMFISPLKLD